MTMSCQQEKVYHMKYPYSRFLEWTFESIISCGNTPVHERRRTLRLTIIHGLVRRESIQFFSASSIQVAKISHQIPSLSCILLVYILLPSFISCRVQKKITLQYSH